MWKKRKGVKDKRQLKIWEENHMKILKAISRAGKKGELIFITEICKKVEKTLPVVLNHFRALESVGVLRRRGKTGYEIMRNLYIRDEPKKILREEIVVKIVEDAETLRMKGHPDFDKITTIQQIPSIISAEDERNIRRVIDTSIRNYRGRPTVCMMAFIINTKPVQFSGDVNVGTQL